MYASPVTSQPRNRGSQDTLPSARSRAVASTRSSTGRVLWARLVPAQCDEGFSWEDTEPVESLGSAVRTATSTKAGEGTNGRFWFCISRSLYETLEMPQFS